MGGSWALRWAKSAAAGLQVSVLWIQEDARGQGYGRDLLERLEDEAVRRGALCAYLDTFSYLVKPFYERNGYEVFGTLEDYPPGHSRYFMRKRLAVEES